MGPLKNGGEKNEKWGAAGRGRGAWQLPQTWAQDFEKGKNVSAEKNANAALSMF